MPRGSLKDADLYDELRADGASKEKAARISNAAAARGRSRVGTQRRGSGLLTTGPWRDCGPRAGTRPPWLLGPAQVRAIDLLRNH